MLIPANIDEHKKAFAASLAKKPDTDTDTETNDKPENDPSRRTLSKIGKLNKRNKELQAQLDNANTTMAEREKIVKEMQDNYTKLETENEQLRKENDELKPYAKSARDAEHKERHQLLANVPPEEQKDWKDAPIHLLRRYAGKAAPATEADKAKPKDWNAMKPEELSKAIAEDPKGYREFMATAK